MHVEALGSIDPGVCGNSPKSLHRRVILVKEQFFFANGRLA